MSDMTNIPKLHDFAFTGFTFDYDNKEIHMSCENIFLKKRCSLCFKEIYYFEGQNCGFWGGGDAIMSIDRIDVAPYIQKLSSLHKMQNVIREISFDKLQGISWFLNSGDECVVICKDIMIEMAELNNVEVENTSVLERVVEMISNENTDIQREGVELGSELRDLVGLIQSAESMGSDAVLRNCARIISMKSDSELTPYIMFLIPWVKDSSKPGADILFERLFNYGDIKVLAYWVEKFVSDEENEKKACHLAGLAGFLRRKDLFGSLSEKCKNLLLQEAIDRDC